MDLITSCDQTRYAMEMLLPYRCKYCTRHFQNFLTYQSHKSSHELKYYKFWCIHHRQPRRRTLRRKIPRKIRLAAKSSKRVEQVKYLYAKNSDGEVVVCDYRGKKFRKLLKNKVFEKVHAAGRSLPCQYMFAAYKSKGMVGEEEMEEVVKNRRKGGVRRMKQVAEMVGRKFVCRVCDKQFNKSYAWELHEKSHSMKAGKMSVGTPAFSCKICAKVFHDVDVLKLHERSHSFMAPEKNSLPKIAEGACMVKVAKVVLEDVISEGQVNGAFPFHCKHCMQEFADRNEWELHERSHTFMNSNQKVLTLKIRETLPPSPDSVKLEEVEDYADSVKFELGDAFGDSFRLEEVKPSGDLLDMEIAQALADSVKVEQVPSLDGLVTTDHFEMNHNHLQIDIKEECSKRGAVIPSNVKQESAIAMPAPSSYHESSYDADVDKKELLLESLSLYRVGSEPTRLQRVTTQLKEQLKKKTYAVPIVKPTPFQQVLLPCCYCNMKFRTVNELAQHDKIHAKRSTSKRPFQCGLCGKIFTQSGSLRAHERIHTGERPYACHLCDKRFHESGKLRRHQRTHTGEKPYECRFCGRMFAQSGTRNSHQKTHREFGVGKMGMGGFSNAWSH